MHGVYLLHSTGGKTEKDHKCLQYAPPTTRFDRVLNQDPQPEAQNNKLLDVATEYTWFYIQDQALKQPDNWGLH